MLANGNFLLYSCIKCWFLDKSVGGWWKITALPLNAEQSLWHQATMEVKQWKTGGIHKWAVQRWVSIWQLWNTFHVKKKKQFHTAFNIFMEFSSAEWREAVKKLPGSFELSKWFGLSFKRHYVNVWVMVIAPWTGNTDCTQFWRPVVKNSLNQRHCLMDCWSGVWILPFCFDMEGYVIVSNAAF